MVMGCGTSVCVCVRVFVHMYMYMYICPRKWQWTNTSSPQSLQPPAPPIDEVASTIRAVRRYNEDLMKGRLGQVGEEVAPPIPLKKKTGELGDHTHSGP